MSLIATIILAVEATKIVVSYRLTPLFILAVGPPNLFDHALESTNFAGNMFIAEYCTLDYYCQNSTITTNLLMT